MEYKSIPLAAARIKAAATSNARAIEVYASTFVTEPDSYGDVVEPGAFARTLRERGTTRVGLRDHVTTQVVGSITDLREDSYGLRGSFNFVEGVQLADETFLLAKAGVLTGVSIGFQLGLGSIRRENGIRYLSDIDLFEISMTAFPANPTAHVVESDDAKALAATLHTLTSTMKTWSDAMRAERSSDPLVESLDREFKQLAAARSMYGDAHPFVKQLVTDLEHRLDAAKLKQSIERLRNSIRNAA